ncbi:MAG TPA: alpha/beta fold hydrolase [Opitutales bacterium]|nr:alpha/beta fold hydrolase [Opitutales bacterium]
MPAWLPKRKRWRLLGIFLVLLALSYLWRELVPATGAPLPGQESVEVLIIDADGDPLGSTTTVYYRDLRPPDNPSAPVVVLLHGSIPTDHDRDALAKALSAKFRVIVPDLPGFGSSDGPDLPDYSPLTYANELDEFLAALHIQRAHFIAYGIGGAIALELADNVPERVQSLTLLDAIGTVEFQWLGDPMLNHAIYGAQLGAFNAARVLLPHFGLLDSGPFNFASVRIFWDTDHDGLRDLLSGYHNPMLIVHAQDDFTATLASAKENYRIVPQSQLVVIPGGHSAGLRHPELVVPAITDFIERAERGEERTKAEAAPQRLLESRKGVVITGPSSRTYEAMLLFIVGLLSLFGEDATCIGAGLLVARGVLGFWPVMGALLAAIFAGNLMYYFVGRRLGAPALQHPLFRWAIKESDLQRMTVLFNERGTWIVFVSRFVPASRLPVFMCAGILRFPFWRMFIALVISNLLFTPLFVWTASLFGYEMFAMIEHYEKAALFVVVICVVVVLTVLHIVQPLCTWRGRRLWRSRWRRLTQWEFWPSWLVQAPILPSLIRLAKKSGGGRVFTCANRQFHGGGFVGAPKAAFLRALAGIGGALPQWTLLPPAKAASLAVADARAGELDAWRSKTGLPWPVVLKRDVGGQGLGVGVCRSRAEAAKYFANNIGAVIAQEYVPGAEFSLWYAREPDAPAGRILAVAEARFPAVTGDGRHKLDYLILSDTRALCSGRIFLAKHAARIADTPAAGEVVQLSEIAQPSDGAYALDATTELITPELSAAIDQLARTMPEFHFGRITVRCPSRDDLRAGRNLRVLGAAGVKAAASIIRDPGRSATEERRLALRRWEICFAIGAAMRARGARPATWKEIVQGIFRARFGG